MIVLEVGKHIENKATLFFESTFDTQKVFLEFFILHSLAIHSFKELAEHTTHD